MATARIKKVIKIDGSLAIMPPCQWAKGKVKLGEEMVVVSNGALRIFPVHLEHSEIQQRRSPDNGTVSQY